MFAFIDRSLTFPAERASYWQSALREQPILSGDHFFNRAGLSRLQEACLRYEVAQEKLALERMHDSMWTRACRTVGQAISWSYTTSMRDIFESRHFHFSSIELEKYQTEFSHRYNDFQVRATKHLVEDNALYNTYSERFHLMSEQYQDSLAGQQAVFSKSAIQTIAKEVIAQERLRGQAVIIGAGVVTIAAAMLLRKK